MVHTSADLTPEQALIWRLVHRDNLPWILDHGLHCANSPVPDPHYVEIGLPDLIEDRRRHQVKISPYGTLADYVPFYFTPFSPMAYRICTGRGVSMRARSELCFLVSSLPHLVESQVRFLITDRHASLATARYFTDLGELSTLNWVDWQTRRFTKDPQNPEPFERYQAEALVHRHLPVAGLLGVVCHDRATHASIEADITSRSLALKLRIRPEWYFQ